MLDTRSVRYTMASMNSLTKAEYLLHYSVQKPKECRESSTLFTQYFEQACYEETPDRMIQWLQENYVGLQIIHRLLTEPHENVIKDTIGDVFSELP